MGVNHAILPQIPEGNLNFMRAKKLPEDSQKKPDVKREDYLMWGCFVNWAATLEKIDKGLITRKEE